MYYISGKYDNDTYGVTDSKDNVEEKYTLSELRASGVSIYGLEENKVTVYKSLSDIVDRYNLLHKLSGDNSHTLFLADDGTIGYRYNSVVECPDRVSVPDFISHLGSYCFVEQEYLKEVDLSNARDLVDIDDFAFMFCPNLKRVVLPDSVMRIGESVFSCGTFKSINLPSNLRVLESSVFSQCDELESIVLPNSIKEIGDGVFDCCYNLRSVVLPDKLVSLPPDSFLECRSLESITLPECLEVIGENAFASTGLKDIQLPCSLKRIEREAFTDCSNLRGVFIPDSVIEIESEVFSFCEVLKEIRLPANVELIDYGGLLHCKRLERIVVPKSSKAYFNLISNGKLKSKVIAEEV